MTDDDQMYKHIYIINNTIISIVITTIFEPVQKIICLIILFYMCIGYETSNRRPRRAMIT